MDAVNAARSERGLPLLAFPLKNIQASAGGLAPLVTAEDLAPPVGGERRFEISIKDLQVPAPQPSTMPSQPAPEGPRWTEPQPAVVRKKRE
jgi:hypothetical protein